MMETIAANIFVETVYPGVNVGCFVTDVGAVCVDTPLLPGEAQRWRARIRSWGADLVRFVVYTNGQSERVLGTQYFVFDERPPNVEQAPVRQSARPQRGLFSRFVPQVTAEQYNCVQRGAVVAHKQVWEQVKEYSSDSFRQSMVDMLGDRDPDMVNLKVLLPQITFDEQIHLYVGNTVVTLLAAAQGTLWVWLPEQQVLFTGDTVVAGTHPPLAVVSLQEWLKALERLRQEPQFQTARLVPGRGPLSDISVTEPLIEYLSLAFEKTKQIFQAGRSKADLNDLAAEMVPLYPVPDGQLERVQRQIKLALDDLYDAFRVGETATD
jgi:glyoxylase-like metal-dependent hydrolase (beta-lactamase superfamily II)